MWVWHGGGPWELFSFVVFVLFWIGVVWLIVTLVRRDRDSGPPAGPRRPPALDVLEERYARGEISQEEFLERRTVLLGGHPQAAPPTGPPERPITATTTDAARGHSMIRSR